MAWSEFIFVIFLAAALIGGGAAMLRWYRKLIDPSIGIAILRFHERLFRRILPKRVADEAAKTYRSFERILTSSLRMMVAKVSVILSGLAMIVVGVWILLHMFRIL